MFSEYSCILFPFWMTELWLSNALSLRQGVCPDGLAATQIFLVSFVWS